MQIRTLILLGLAGIALSGCGRVSNPKAPDNAFYPHTYIVRSSENELNQRKTDTAGVKDTGENNAMVRNATTHVSEIKEMK